MKQLKLPLTRGDILALHAGEAVTISGVIYTARDAAHKRITDAIDRGDTLPFDLEGACIYYAGPCPEAPGEVIGPCGPTTSGRMDKYTPKLIENGLGAMIGKGKRADAVKAAMAGRAVYFAATGGAAMLIADCVRECEIIAYPELGAEAVRRLRVENLPVVVAVDAHGMDAYERQGK